MAADHGLNAGIEEPVIDLIDLRSGDAEYVFRPARLERLHDYVCPGHGSLSFACARGFNGHGCAVRSFGFVIHLCETLSSWFIRPFEGPQLYRYSCQWLETILDRADARHTR